MSRAFCMIRDQPVYRRDAFMAGLKAAGYDVRTGQPTSVHPGDVLLMWNRYSPNHELACRVEEAGGTVAVAENGYVGPGGVSPHQMEPREIYALAIGGHNGSGRWSVGGSERWAALGIDLKPWRTSGEHVLVCPNRSFGRPDMLMPVGWADDVKKRLQCITERPIKVRPHPGNGAPKTLLADDLRDCWAMVIWSSSAGVQALIAGIPVIHCAPWWICDWAATRNIGAVETPFHKFVNREKAMYRLAWAQFHVREIASGMAFRHLLQTEEATV